MLPTPVLVLQELTGSKIRHAVVAGRYGLGSKEFTPAMVVAAFDNLAAASPKRRFTVSVRGRAAEA